MGATFGRSDRRASAASESKVVNAMRELPAGNVTFVFTDIEASTRLLRALGDRYFEVLERHRLLLGQAWSAHCGCEVSVSGDSVFIAFAQPADAARACVEGQRLLAAERWPGEVSVRVRMGIHGGLAAPRNDDYVALAVHQTARVTAAANGGQILMSGETAGQLQSLDNFEAIPLGNFRLRDFDGHVPLFALSGPGFSSAVLPVRATPADRHNLVVQPTPFVGRDEDVDGVVKLVQPGRLLTLTGPGGVGKTRLASEAGVRLAETWPDGVWMVDLAPVREGAQVGAAIARALGVSGSDAWEHVIDHLRTRAAVVFLDNCEHLGPACVEAVDRLLSACPRCSVIATSRESLDVAGQWLWRVNPLSPAMAAELFMDRGRRVDPSIEVNDQLGATVAEICARLDGLPLALELAAARLAALSPEEVLAGLEDRFRLLRTTSTHVPERQRTMRGLLEWSDRLLTAAERTCLRRLAMFAGSFSLAAATAAAAEDCPGGLVSDDVADLVFALVDKSLVVADLRANGTRYQLLESVRSFAFEGLVESDELDSTAQRLAMWYLERVGPEHRHAPGWVSAVSTDIDNLRILVAVVGLSQPERAQVLAYVVSRYLDSAHAYRDGLRELTGHLEELTAPTAVRVCLLTSFADLSLRTGDLEPAQRALDEAVSLHAVVGALPAWDDVAIERTRGDLASRRGDHTAAITAAKRVLETALSPRGRCRMWSQLGIASTAVGDYETARRAFTEELVGYRALGDDGFQMSAEGNLAEVAMRIGDIAAAARHQKTCLELARAVGAPVMIAFSLIVAARLEALDGAWGVAVELHSQAESILEATGGALYDDDRAVSEAMLDDARQALGTVAFDSEVAAGRALDQAAAAELGITVLTRRDDDELIAR
ncbi:MAG: hypothetical protein NVS3B21_21560 [Acidimicrobiales bacterium]